MIDLRKFAAGSLIVCVLACTTVTRAVGLVPSTATSAPTATVVPATSPVPVDTATPAAGETPATPAPEIPAPTYVPPDCENGSLATVPPATTIALPTLSLEANPSIDTDVQLRVFDDTVNKINEVYLYPDFNGIDWPAIAADTRTRIEAGLDTEAFYNEMSELIIALGDEHSHFESPVGVAASEAELAGTNDYVGIGVLGQPLLEKGRVTILAVFPDSPAMHAGLQQHDSLLSVDGLPVVQDGVPYFERIRGPECSAVVLEIQSPGSEPRLLTVIRHRITNPLPLDAKLVSTTDGSRIGYIFLPTFFDETIPGQVRQALEDFGPLDGLILDNRMNGGGSSTVLEPIASYFASGTLGNFVSRTSQRPLEVTADPVQNSQTVPLVILVGEDTVSFGEIFSGAMHDIGRALLAGETTLGNVETLHGYSFEDGSRIWIAEEKFDPLVSHADWEADGIVPDLQASADWDTFTFENDPGVAAALTLLGHP